MICLVFSSEGKTQTEKNKWFDYYYMNDLIVLVGIVIDKQINNIMLKQYFKNMDGNRIESNQLKYSRILMEDLQFDKQDEKMQRTMQAPLNINSA